MNVVKIQVLLLILGALVIWLFRSDYISYILGNVVITIPTFLFAIIWNICGFFAYQKNAIIYLFAANILKFFLVLLMLFLVIVYKKNIQSSIMFLAFILSCKAYLLAGLVFKRGSYVK